MKKDTIHDDTPVVETPTETQEAPAQEESTETPVATEDEWRTALETAVRQRDEYLDLAQRTQADFSNFRKRNQQVRTDAYDDGVRETIAAILPAIDSIDKAIQAAEQAQDDSALAQGVKLVRRQLFDQLSKIGLEEVPALGEKFDPELHNAVQRTTDGEPGTVTEVFQTGYRVKGRIIRYAMVKVCVEE